MINRENQRIRLTKRMLRESMMELLKEKSVESISVKELCERAEINRSTFYTHYCDVFELYKEMETEFIASLNEYILQVQKEGPHSDEAEMDAIQLMLEYIQDHADLYRALFFGNRIDSAQSTYARAQRNIIDQLMKLYPDIEPVQKEYIFQFCVQGGNGIIWHWMKSGFNVEPVELAEMIRTYTNSVVRCVSL